MGVCLLMGVCPSGNPPVLLTLVSYCVYFVMENKLSLLSLSLVTKVVLIDNKDNQESRTQVGVEIGTLNELIINFKKVNSFCTLN